MAGFLLVFALVMFSLVMVSLSSPITHCSTREEGSLIFTSDPILREGEFEITSRASQGETCVVSIQGNQTAVRIAIEPVQALLPSQGCQGKVRVYDSNGSLIGQEAVCAAKDSTFPESFQSTQRELRIEVESLTPVFFLTIEHVSVSGLPLLGNRLELLADAGWRSLNSFGYPTSYPSSMDFVYVFQGRGSGRIEISVMVLLMDKPTVPCTGDYIEAFEEKLHDSTALGRWCSGQPTISSQSSTVSLRLHTDVSGSNSGFVLRYREVMASSHSRILHFSSSEWDHLRQCPDVSDLRADNITRYMPSSGWKTNHGREMECRWNIHPTGGPRFNVELAVDFANLTSSGNCSEANVTVYDNVTGVLGHFCRAGHTYRGSPGAFLTLHFQTSTDRLQKEPDFRVAYRQVLARGSFPCNQTVTIGTDFSYLESPNYPDNYSHSLNCWWRVEAPSGLLVAIRSEDFRLEGKSHDHCRDWVRLRDGYSYRNSSLGKYCGTSQISRESSGRFMFIHFVTDRSVANAGFRFRLRAQYYPTSCEQGRVVNVTVYKSVSVQSPYYPHHFPANSVCMWRLYTYLSFKAIRLRSANYDLGSAADCRNNMVKVYDGPDRNSQLVGHFCSGQQGSVTSSRGYLFVEFRSGSSQLFNRGFQVRAELTTRTGSYPSSSLPSSNAVSVAVSVGCLFVFMVFCTGACCVMYRKRRQLLQSSDRAASVRGLETTTRRVSGFPSNPGRQGMGRGAQHLQQDRSFEHSPIAYISGTIFWGETSTSDPPPPYPGSSREAAGEEAPPPYHALEFTASLLPPPPYSGGEAEGGTAADAAPEEGCNPRFTGNNQRPYLLASGERLPPAMEMPVTTRLDADLPGSVV